jgi:hypothetical protein
MERSLGISLGGIAGLDILSTGSFTIDYRRKKISFGSIAASEKTVRFETREPFLTIKAVIEGQAVRLLVDSGTWGLLVYRNRLQTTPEQVRFDSNVSIASPGGMTHLRWFRAAVSLGKDNFGARNVCHRRCRLRSPKRVRWSVGIYKDGIPQGVIRLRKWAVWVGLIGKSVEKRRPLLVRVHSVRRDRS